MKVTNLRLLLLSLFTLAVVFQGCKPGEDDPVQQLDPSITFSNAGGATTENDSVTTGTAVSFNVVFTKGNDGKKLGKIRLTANIGSGGAFEEIPAGLVTPAPSDLTLYGNTGEIEINEDTYTINVTNYVGTSEGSVTFRFYVEDKDGNDASRDITIVWSDAVIPPTAPMSYNVAASTTNNVFSLHDSTQTSGTAGGSVAVGSQSLYDLYFFNSVNTNANLVTTDEADNSLLGTFALSNYTAGAATRIRTTTLTAQQFTELVDEDLLANHYATAIDQTIQGWNVSANPPPNAPNGTRVNTSANIAAGKVLAFNANGRFGLILINSVTATDINVSIKVAH